MITKPNCSCGKHLSQLVILYNEEKAKLKLIDGELPPTGEILDKLKIVNRCCRSVILTGRYFDDFLNPTK